MYPVEFSMMRYKILIGGSHTGSGRFLVGMAGSRVNGWEVNSVWSRVIVVDTARSEVGGWRYYKTALNSC